MNIELHQYPYHVPLLTQIGGPGGNDFGGIDFSKLGGGGEGMPDMSAMMESMGGMGGMGGPGGPGGPGGVEEEDDEDDDDDDDDEMPALEGNKDAAPKKA